MSSNVPQSGHGASPFTGPNQVLVSNSLNGERTIFDLNSVPVGSLLGRTATGIGVYPTVGGGGGGPTALTLDDLTDVRTTSPEPTIGQVLTYDGTEWVPATSSAGTFADGTLGAPSITFTSDTNTGFFRPAADTISATAGGVLAMLLDGSADQNTTFGVGATLTAISNATLVGAGAAATGTLGECVAVGSTAQCERLSVAVGFGANAQPDISAGGVSVGRNSLSAGGVAVGSAASSAAGVAVGTGAVSLGGTALGRLSTISGSGDATSVAVGQTATSSSTGAIAIGNACRAAGADSISVGRAAGSSQTGTNCIAIGTGALDGTHNSNTIDTIAIGQGALSGNMSSAIAVNTVAVGVGALGGQTTGANNAAFGHQAGLTSTNQSGQTLIGFQAQSTANDTTCIGALASASALGAIAIGRSNNGPSAVASIFNGLAFPTTLAQVAPGLAVQFDLGAMGPTTSSIRYKKDVTLAPLSPDAPATLKPIDLIRVVEFDSKVDGDDRRHLGMIAEEVVDLLHPSLVPRDTEGNPVGISYDRVVCLCIQEIQLLRRRVATLEGASLPALPEYTPVRARDLYDADQIDDETQAVQKQQYKARSRQLRIDRIVERIEKDPLKETAILNKLNKTTRDAVLKAMEDKATAEAEAEATKEAARVAMQEAEAARLLAEQQAQEEAEAARVAAEEAAAQTEAARLLAAKEARLDALARKKMAANVDLETVGLRMRARIEALLEKDRLALEVAEAARLEAEEVARLAQIAAAEEERRLEEEAENDE